MPPITNRSVRARRTRGAGFTLLEMMLVLVIIGLLTTVAVVSIGGRGKAARIETTKISMRSLKSAIQQYFLEKAAYPATLTALTQGGTAYIDSVPKDAWKREFVYSVPGSNAKPYNLYSLGEDGESGTQDDLDMWTMDQAPQQ